VDGPWRGILLALPFLLLAALLLLWWRFRQKRLTQVIVLVAIPAVSTAGVVAVELRERDYGAAAVWAALGGYATWKLGSFLRRQMDAQER
jgi:O-antigen ligase